MVYQRRLSRSILKCSWRYILGCMGYMVGEGKKVIGELLIEEMM